jgi:hypothetical protein
VSCDAFDNQTASTGETTSTANAESVDKEAEKQRVLSLVARVTEMLRTGTVGPITEQDVGVAKRNFSPVREKTPIQEGDSVGSSAMAPLSKSQHHEADAQRRMRCFSEEATVHPPHIVVDTNNDVTQRIRGCTSDGNSYKEIQICSPEIGNCTSRDTSRRVVSVDYGVGDQPNVGRYCDVNFSPSDRGRVTEDVDLRGNWITAAHDEDLRCSQVPFADNCYKVWLLFCQLVSCRVAYRALYDSNNNSI